MRFLLDRPVPRPVADYLRGELRHDVVDSYASVYEQVPDSGIIRRGVSENRIVITRDDGFHQGNYPLCTHPGIIMLRNVGHRDQREGLSKLSRSPHQSLAQHAVCRLYRDRMEITTQNGRLVLTGADFEVLARSGDQ